MTRSAVRYAVLGLVVEFDRERDQRMGKKRSEGKVVRHPRHHAMNYARLQAVVSKLGALRE